jgi:hypothetical protein
MKKQIFNFIQRKTPNLLKVLEVKLKDTDDEHGIINEHYVVRCLLQVPDTSIPIDNMIGNEEKICLVSVSEFNSWLKREDSIKWV